jgi:type I restriction enzyme S subunit
MNKIWTSCTVQDLLKRGEAELKTGPFGTQLHASDYVKEGTPVINVRNIGLGNIIQDKLEFISEKTVLRLRSHLLEQGDIVFGRKGAVDRHTYIQKQNSRWFQGSDCLRLRLKSPSIDPKFISFCLLSETHKRWMTNQCSHGSTMASLNQEIVSRIPLYLPPLTTQRKITAILSAYDDLIKNNTRRIAILDEMAQSLYREWFVHFRFPGHEKKRLVESELGLIPEGWEVKTIGEVVEILGGGTPATSNLEYRDDGNINWFSPSDLTAVGTMFITNSTKKITTLGLQKSSARMFPAYSVMMTSRATIGVVAINTQSACTNQGFITCIPNENLSAYQIYFWLAENKEKINNLASGATFKEINKATFRKLPIIMLDNITNKRFNEMLVPIGKQIENLIARNAILHQTRDLLLPKLISGVVDVEELDIQIEGETYESRREPIPSIS